MFVSVRVCVLECFSAIDRWRDRDLETREDFSNLVPRRGGLKK